MADFDRELLVDAFASFSNDVAPYVRSSGVAATQETVRRRKRNHTIAAGMLTALVVAVPTVAYAAAGPHWHRAPQVTDTARPGPAPAPSSVNPSVSAAPSTRSSPAPDGRISKAALGNATFDLPAWDSEASAAGCTSGRIKLHEGYKNVAEYLDISLEKVIHLDVDGDGAQETVAQLSCGHEGSWDQVVAFGRDAHGGIRTIGQVAVQAGDIRALCDFRTGTAGTVDVLVGDYPNTLGCPGREPASYMALQWRTYAWTGSVFAQSSGPTAFPVNPKISKLTFTNSDLLFKKASDGSYHGSMTITVSNVGESAIPFQAAVDLPKGMRLVGPSGCHSETDTSGDITVTCLSSPLAPASTTTLTLEVTSPKSPKSIKTDIVPTVDVYPADGYGNLGDTPEVELRIVS